MDLGELSTIVALLVALSVAAERLVEIIKNPISFLREEHKDDPRKEGFRKVALHLLAVVAGIVTALLARPAVEGVVPGVLSSLPGLIALGLLASGGSGFWNSVATYVLNVKNIKDVEAGKVRAEKEMLEAERNRLQAANVES